MPIVIGPPLQALACFGLFGVLLCFFMAGLLFALRVRIYWELIASRRGSALSFHLRSAALFLSAKLPLRKRRPHSAHVHVQTIRHSGCERALNRRTHLL